jgi:hypothetical protein
MADRRAVFKESIDNWVKDKKIDRYYECSALTGENITDIFTQLTSDYCEKLKEELSRSSHY